MPRTITATQIRAIVKQLDEAVEYLVAVDEKMTATGHYVQGTVHALYAARDARDRFRALTATDVQVEDAS